MHTHAACGWTRRLCFPIFGFASFLTLPPACRERFSSPLRCLIASLQLHVPPLYSVLFLQSARSISAVPAITSSSSLASNTDTSRTSTTWKHRQTDLTHGTTYRMSIVDHPSSMEGVTGSDTLFGGPQIYDKEKHQEAGRLHSRRLTVDELKRCTFNTL